MKLMLDLNVLLDYFQKRDPHYQYSSIVISEALKAKVKGLIPAHALTTLYYLISKYADREQADEKTDWMLEHFEIAFGDKSLFLCARALQMKDFEDGVVASFAEAFSCDYIVTRNVPDFEHSPIPAITPEEYVRRYVTVE